MKKNHLTLILLFLLLSSACDFRVERDYSRLVYRLGVEPVVLNPVICTDAASYTVISFLFDPLIEMDNETFEWKPMLAKRWEVSTDHLQYTFYLRDDVYWHDGVKFTADDVIYTFNAIMDPKVDAAPKRVYYRDVLKVEKLGDYTVRFTYKYPYYRALTMLGGLQPIPRHIFENAGDFNKAASDRRNAVGNGPFKFVEWKTGQLIVLDRNEGYWGAAANLTGITFRVITDDNVALQVLKKGEIDVMGLRTIQWVKQTESENFKRRFDKYKYFPPGITYIGWNRERPFFNDPRVRRALAMLFDREKVRESLYYGLAEVITSDIYKFIPEYNTDIRPYPFDPAAAARLLDEAGWKIGRDGIREKDGVPFKFTIMIVPGRSAENLANILRENLKKAGVEMDVARFEWSVFLKNLHDSAFDAVMSGWTGQLEPDPYQLWHSSQAGVGSNYIHFKNDEVDAIIENVRSEFDREKRKRLLWRFQEILHDDQPYMFLFMPASLVAIDKRFTNVKIYKLGIDIREWDVMKPDKPLYE